MSPLPSGVRPDGCWSELLRPSSGAKPGPALFLDRDGVVVEERDYLRRIEDLAIIPGAAEAIAAANRAGWHVVLVTNQSGIARGYLDWDAFAAIQRELLRRLAEAGAGLDMVLACPHHAEGVAYRHPDHPWRKPNPGMLAEAAAQLPIDLGRSWIVGDKLDDLLAGHAAGLVRAAHVLTGHGITERAKVTGTTIPGLIVDLWDSIGEAGGLFTSAPSTVTGRGIL